MTISRGEEMIIRYPKSLSKDLKVTVQSRGKERGKGYREILEEVDEEYVSNLVLRKKVDSYREILNDIDEEFIEEMI